MKLRNIIGIALIAISVATFAQGPDTSQTINKGKYAPGTVQRDTDDQAWDKVNENKDDIYRRIKANYDAIESGTSSGVDQVARDSTVANAEDIAATGTGYKLTGGDGKRWTDGNGKTIIGR